MWAERLIRRKSSKADSSQLTADSKTTKQQPLNFRSRLAGEESSLEWRSVLRPYRVKANLAFAFAALVLHAR